MSTGHSITLLSDEAFGWYVTGFTDGEGTFNLGTLRQTRPNGRIYHQWHVRFAISLRQDEAPNLEAIAERFGCGYVRRRAGSKCGAEHHSKPKITWMVHAIGDLAGIVVPHFEQFPLQCKKARDFVIWRRAVILLKEINGRSGRGRGNGKGKHKFTFEDRRQLATIANELRAVRVYGSDPESIALPEPEDEFFPLFPE